MIVLIRLVIHSYIPFAEIIKPGNCSSEGSLPVVCNKILQLVLCLLDMPQNSSYICITMEFAPVFKLEHSRYCLMISFCVCRALKFLKVFLVSILLVHSCLTHLFLHVLQFAFVCQRAHS